jgi:hypothetical protein
MSIRRTLILGGLAAGLGYHLFGKSNNTQPEKARKSDMGSKAKSTPGTEI